MVKGQLVIACRDTPADLVKEALHKIARSYNDFADTIAWILLSTSSSVVRHEETLMRMAALPCQWVGPNQQVPSA